MACSHPWTRENPNDPLCTWHRTCINNSNPKGRYRIILKSDPFIIITDNLFINNCHFHKESIIENNIFLFKHLLIINGWRVVPRVYGCECQIPIYDDTYDSVRELDMKQILPIVENIGTSIM